VYLSTCETYLNSSSSCLLVSRGLLYADELYVYVRNKPGYVFGPGEQPSGTGKGYNSSQFGYGSEFHNEWALHRKHCDDNFRCPPTDNSGYVQSSTEATGCYCNGGYLNGQSCYADADCQLGDQQASSTWAGNCHDGQDNLGAYCSAACECSSGLLCSWYAGTLGGEAQGLATTMQWIYSTTLQVALPASCPGGVIDSGTITAVASSTVMKLDSSAAPFDGIYIGFSLQLTTTTSPSSGVGSYNLTDVRDIVGYNADRFVTVSSSFGAYPTTTSRYEVRTNGPWYGYPSQVTDCQGFTTVVAADASNIASGSYILIDDEILEVVGVQGNNLTTRRARSGSVAAAHAVGAAINIISDTGVLNSGISASAQLDAKLQASISIQQGGILRRCATLTLDSLASSTDNVYRNWYVAITSGVGVAQSARVLHYDGTNKLAVIDCIQQGQYWTGYAQAGYTSGYSGQGYGAFSSTGNNPTACRRSWIVPPAASYRYYRLRVMKATSGWTSRWYSPGFACTGCCIAGGWSIQEIQLFQDASDSTQPPQRLSVSAATNPYAPAPVSSSVTSQTVKPVLSNSPNLAIDNCPSSPGSEISCPSLPGQYCDSNSVSCGSSSFYEQSNNGATCDYYELTPLILDLGSAKRVDKYRFATTSLSSAYGYEPVRWMFEGTNDGTAAGGDAYDPYGYCGGGINLPSNGSCLCSSTGLPYCSTDPGVYAQDCSCRSRWNTLHDMSKSDYQYSLSESVRGAWVPSTSSTVYAGYFSIPRSTYQLCPNYVDSNGVCNQGPCTEVACAGPTGDVDPVSVDYLKQARSFASQYLPATNEKGSKFRPGDGSTSGGALGNDVTGKPLWGNPVSTDRANKRTGRDSGDLMAVGDFSYKDRGIVFLMRRKAIDDYLSYFERYQYYPMPLPTWVD